MAMLYGMALGYARKSLIYKERFLSRGVEPLAARRPVRFSYQIFRFFRLCCVPITKKNPMDGSKMVTKTTEIPRKPKAKPQIVWPTLPSAEMAAICGFSQEMLRRIERAGAFKKISKDRYNPPDVFRGVLNYMRDDARRSSKSAEAAEVQKARAEEIRLRIAREQGSLVELASAEAVFANILGALRSELAGVAAASTRDLTLRETIDRNINDAIARARNRFREFRQALRAGGNSGVDDSSSVS